MLFGGQHLLDDVVSRIVLRDETHGKLLGLEEHWALTHNLSALHLTHDSLRASLMFIVSKQATAYSCPA
jgi:hypothetical protein